MANYSRPDVYVEDKSRSINAIEANGALIPVFIGTCKRGKIGVPFLIQNFTEYEKTQELTGSVYLKDSDLAYAIKNYYENAKTPMWVIRVGSSSAKLAEGTLLPTGVVIIQGETHESMSVDGANNAQESVGEQQDENVKFVAYDEGVWANGIVIEVKKNVDDESLFDLTLSKNDIVREAFVGLSNDVNSREYFYDVINASSEYIKVVASSAKLVEGTATMSGGADSSLPNDNDYVEAIDKVSLIKYARLLVVPGVTSQNVLSKMLAYCMNERPEIYPIMDMPLMSTVNTALDFRSAFSGKGSFYYSWLSMLDPASSIGANRVIPASGGIAGVYSRMINANGADCNPAGTEAIIYGVNGIVNPSSLSEMELLNPKGINSIRKIENVGICVWGCRTISTDSKFKYVSDCILDAQIKQDILNGMLWAVFRGNCDETYRDIRNVVRTYMLGLMRNGLLASKIEAQAFSVKCDDELNTIIEKDKGEIISEIAYARKRPGEFIIFRIDQRTEM